MKLILKFNTIKNAYTERSVFYIKTFFYVMNSWYSLVVRYRLHVLVWAIYITYEISLLAGLGVYGTPMNWIFHYTLLIILFYFHAHISMHWAMHSSLNAFWRVPLIIVLEIFIYILLSFCGDHVIAKFGLLGITVPPVITKTYALNNCFRLFNVLGISTGYYFLLTYNRERQKSEELERQKL